jgi:hypothetical protein
MSRIFLEGGWGRGVCRVFYYVGNVSGGQGVWWFWWVKKESSPNLKIFKEYF